MIKVSYFPGCTLRTKAKQLDLYARKCAEVLGVELCEIENWQCCGGVFVSNNAVALIKFYCIGKGNKALSLFFFFFQIGKFFINIILSSLR